MPTPKEIMESPLSILIGQRLPEDKINFIKRQLKFGISPARVFTLAVDVETTKGFGGLRRRFTYLDLGLDLSDFYRYKSMPLSYNVR